MMYYPDSICPACKVELRHHDENQVVECWNTIGITERSAAMIQSLKTAGKVAANFGTQTFDTLNEDITSLKPKAWLDAIDWYRSESNGLILHGTPGTGKTHSARCVMYDAIFDDKSVIEVTAHKMLHKGMQYGAESYGDALSRAYLLLIDDIDKAVWNNRSTTFLWTILNDREMRGNRTIITTNVEKSKFRDIFADGDAENGSIVESMLQRLHPITTIEFKGESVRGIV